MSMVKDEVGRAEKVKLANNRSQGDDNLFTREKILVSISNPNLSRMGRILELDII